MMRRRDRVHASRLGNLLLVLFGIAGLWWIGLFRFVDAIPESIVDQSTITDAIVVLTGGSGRLDEGLDLLGADRGQRLFVSGVYKGMEVRSLLNLSRKGRGGLEPRIAIGNAENTRENAEETSVWVSRNEVKTLRLVTAAYHMPRSLLEFQYMMPDISVIPNPVFPDHVKQQRWWSYPGTAMLMSSEYNKFLLAWVRHWGERILIGKGSGKAESSHFDLPRWLLG